jgi:hypothetical protein
MGPPPRAPSLFRKAKRKQPPPTAIDTASERCNHVRSSSLGQLVSRILPSNRAEKGGTREPGLNVENGVGHFDAGTGGDGVGKERDDAKGWMARKSWPGENVGAGDGHSGGALRRILGSIKRTKEVDTVNVEGGDGHS